jgi:hypothetical protein
MWLLLVPYMLVNLAGWALPPASSHRHRAAVAVVRIAGLALTLVFSLVTATGVIAVGAYQVVRLESSWSVALTLGVVVSALVMVVLWFATTRADDARNDRPYLRAPHVAIALWGIWATAITAAAEASGSANPIGTMWLLPAALFVLTASASVWHDLEDVVRVFGRVAVAATVVLLVSVLTRPLGALTELPEALTTVGGPLRGAVLFFAVAGIAATALAWSRDHPDAGPAVGTLLSMAGATGAAVGSGLVVVTGAMFGVDPAPAAGTLAEAFTVGTCALLLLVGFHSWTHAEPGSRPLERLMRTLVSVRDDIRPILMSVPIVAVAVGAVAVAGFGDVLPALAAVLAPAAVIAISAVGVKLGYRVVPAIIVTVGLAVVTLAATGVVTFRAAAVVFTLVLPTAAVLARVAGAIGSADRRRALAIPWDVGSFFSRRFHPFAPPTYRDIVERDLRMVLSQLRSAGDIVTVSAHSQGSIVAAAALGGGPDDEVDLLTHGSPFGTLYMRMFPVSFPPDVVKSVLVRRWINLWRPTDPIGGAIRGVDDRRVDDRKLRIHGGYWLADETEYAVALDDLSGESRP